MATMDLVSWCSRFWMVASWTLLGVVTSQQRSALACWGGWGSCSGHPAPTVSLRPMVGYPFFDLTGPCRGCVGDKGSNAFAAVMSEELQMWWELTTARPYWALCLPACPPTRKPICR